MSRYHVSSSEGPYEKDSCEQVLANMLGIATSDEMDEAELVLLEQLSVAMLKSWHRRWLGNIYEWAGQERAVNISKGKHRSERCDGGMLHYRVVSVHPMPFFQ